MASAQVAASCPEPTDDQSIHACIIGLGYPRPRSFRGQTFIGANLQGLDLSGCDLSGADLSGADLTGTRLVSTNLQDAILHEANLEQCEFLKANLTNADLSNARAHQAGFCQATLDGASFLEAQLDHSSFSGASAIDTDFRAASLFGTRLSAADLTGADLRRASLEQADLSQAILTRSRLDGASLREARLGATVGYTTASWIGVDVREVNFCGAHLLRRHILDANYLHEFRHQSPTNEWFYRVWWLTSDCGRSFRRWGLWTALIAVVFAAIYTFVDVDYGAHETLLSPLYFSVVTLTTLGYGDVLPASLTAQVVCMVEVVLGYVMLGGALSIFTTKMARRAS